ncbi:hypothetical protein DFH09DRAFT_1414008 [Mycena vulgaris]|nr:hypothetical protein DFH09DRAFT_1414008 [Mycena vulgaris]
MPMRGAFSLKDARAASSAVASVVYVPHLFCSMSPTEDFRVRIYGPDYGYISVFWNYFGEYDILQPTQDGALEVSFLYSPDAATQIAVTATNGPNATFPLVGARNLAEGAPSYLFFGGTTTSPPGSPPHAGDNSYTALAGYTRRFESAIWSYRPATQALTAQWVNTDGSMPATHIFYANYSDNALGLTGDITAFRTAFRVRYPEVLLGLYELRGHSLGELNHHKSSDSAFEISLSWLDRERDY